MKSLFLATMIAAGAVCGCEAETADAQDRFGVVAQFVDEGAVQVEIPGTAARVLEIPIQTRTEVVADFGQNRGSSFGGNFGNQGSNFRSFSNSGFNSNFGSFSNAGFNVPFDQSPFINVGCHRIREFRSHNHVNFSGNFGYGGSTFQSRRLDLRNARRALFGLRQLGGRSFNGGGGGFNGSCGPNGCGISINVN